MALARSSHIVVLSERITQVHTLYPSLGVRKWSIYKSARSLVSPHEETETKQKTSKTHKANKKPTKASKERTDKTAPKSHSSWCAGELNDLAHERKRNPRPRSKILRRCPAKHITQQRRNPGSPLPGSRRSH